MTRRAAPLLLSCLAFALALSARGAESVPPGFTALANGTDLAGWWGLGTEDPAVWQALPPEALAAKKQASLADIAKHWRVENGELVNDGDGLYLTTDRDYGDFELRLEYRTVAKADSGIYLRGLPQVQIWDTTKDGGKWDIGADKGSGGLWNNAAGAAGKDPLVHADKPFGEWNRVRVVMVGERVTVVLNDRLVVDHARLANHFARGRPVPRTGPIQLQTHGGEIRWRNVAIRPIPSAEAIAILANDGPADVARAAAPLPWVAAFNGRDFAGWSGPVDNYRIDDGAIVCLPGKGGTIHTTEVYGDFEARIEFRLPPAGNNGLAIRYPGTGDTAYVGMCELQVLDDAHPNYSKIDPRQRHGSAYGMVAAHPGYLNPTGEWNHQQITVRGSTIRVELNGTVILDSDLGAVSEFLEGKPHPGKDRREGHFGFAGHNDPVAFRNVRIRRL